MTTARDIMHSGAQCIKEDQTLSEAAMMMRDLGVGSLPICGSDDRLQGIITDRDIVVKCLAEGKDASAMHARELAQGTPYWVDAGSGVDDVLTMMEQRQVKRLPVMENHRLVGMISEADLARGISDDQLAHFVESVYARS